MSYSYNYNKVTLFLIAFVLLCLFIPGIISSTKLHYRWIYTSWKVESIVSESEICTEGPRGQIHTCVNRYAYIGFDSSDRHQQIKMLIENNDSTIYTGSSVDFIYDPRNLSNFRRGDGEGLDIWFVFLAFITVWLASVVFNYFRNL